MDDELLGRFRRAYWATIHGVDALRLRAWEDRGLTLPQLRVLFLLRQHPGATTNFLSDRLGVTVSTVSGLVDKLARAGLVERRPDPRNRRIVPLGLTAEGEAVVGEVRQINRSYLDRVAADLGDDLGAVADALERLAEASRRVPAEARPERAGVGT
jgi:DNA-binding MarR family transcriptional regulator